MNKSKLIGLGIVAYLAVGLVYAYKSSVALYFPQEDVEVHPSGSFLAALKSGDEESVKAHLAAGAFVNANIINGKGPLHVAAFEGRAEVSELLIDAGSDINRADVEGFTPLHLAAAKGHVAVANVLLEKNADVNAKLHNHRTPLYFAAIGGHREMVETLLGHGADIDVRGDDGFTALGHVVGMEQVDVIKLLVANGADVNVKGGKKELSPLLIAADRANTSIAEFLLDHGADPNSRTARGNTACHYAAVQNDRDTIELLLTRHANPHVANDQGVTPAQLARRAGHESLAARLESLDSPR